MARIHNVTQNSVPTVSVIIVNWNGLKWLKNCLDSLVSQTLTSVQIIFVDNDSKDNSINFVNSHYPKVEVYQTGSNLGFAGGNNFGFKHVRGKYTYLLNNDTVLEKDCLEKLVLRMEDDARIGSLQSKIMLLEKKDTLDLVGSFWTATGLLYYFGHSGKENDALYNKRIAVFSNKGASMMLRTEALRTTGLFDEDFWCYYEETDLCHRLWIAGYECWYEPSARMYHANGGTALTFENDFIQFHNFKNKLCSFLKCYELNQLVIFLPLYFALICCISIYWLAQGKYKHFLAIHKATLWNARHIKKTLAKRAYIQSIRTVSDKSIFKLVKRKPGFSYYTHLLTGKLAQFNDQSI